MDFNQIAKNWQVLWMEILSDPKKFNDLYQAYLKELMALSHHLPSTFDKRFHDEAWEKNTYFHYLKELYLLNVKYTLAFLDKTQEVDNKIKQKMRFSMEQWLNAVSPSNYLFTNPAVLKKTIETKGDNLVKGMQNFITDMKNSQDFLKIKMTDHTAFEIGKDLAITPGKIIYQNDLIQLIQYTPTTKTTYKIPLLIIPPWINKYYILDLQPKNSLTKFLVDQGYTVFMISWVNPDSRHADKDFSSYLTEGALAAIDKIIKITGCEKVNALGFCIGGTLLASTCAYLTQKNTPFINSATFLATLTDFSEPGDLGAFMDEAQIGTVEKIMAKKGYLDGAYLSLTFNLLRANDLIWSYFVHNYLEGMPPPAFDLLYWNSDATNMPAKMHSQYLRGMYLNNQLAQPGGMVLDDVPIDLSKINLPVYCVATQQDHIAPWKSVYMGMQLFSSDIKFVLGQSGHIAGIVNPPPAKKYGYYTNETHKALSPEKWLSTATLHHESWWVDWQNWLAEHSGEQVLARQPKKSLEDAPGSYVKVRLNSSPL